MVSLFFGGGGGGGVGGGWGGTAVTRDSACSYCILLHFLFYSLCNHKTQNYALKYMFVKPFNTNL